MEDFKHIDALLSGKVGSNFHLSTSNLVSVHIKSIELKCVSVFSVSYFLITFYTLLVYSHCVRGKFKKKVSV